MTLKTSHHERALAAAAGLVGRPRLRAGLLLTLVGACGPGVLDADSDSPTSEQGPGSTDAATTTTATTSASEGATGSSGEGASTTGTTAEPATTGATSAATLLTDATTTDMTTDVTTDMTTGDATTGTDSSGTTGEAGDCTDPRTGEVDWICCERQDWLPAPQCTPWGPPAPPLAGRERLRLARAARGRWA